MKQIRKEEAELYYGDGYSGKDYPMTDKEINVAVIQIDGRSPKSGYQRNQECKELLYIIEGNGMLYSKEKEVIQFKQGDLLIIEKEEAYAFEGKFQAVVPCVPAWRKEQHQYID